jgi:glutamyl-tRNA synthetase
VANGRFAPSPTGSVHIGNLRTALLAWLFARSSGGLFVIRMEDLDPITSSREKADSQLRDLALIGLDWDGPVEFQSDNFHRYAAALDVLASNDLVYPCFCTRREIAEASSAPNGSNIGRYPGTCRSLSPDESAERQSLGYKFAVRLLSNHDEVSLSDRVAGQFAGAPDDIVLQRNDHMFAYNLAVVVDDESQGIEEVVRADDLLASTPSQINLGRILGYRPLSYAHVPLVVNGDGQRLAKRDGAVTLDDLRAEGVSVLQVLSRIGESLGLCHWNERITTGQLLHRFDPALIPNRPWVFGVS